MTLLNLITLAAVQAAPLPASAGVKITDIPSVGIVTSFADCIAASAEPMPQQGRDGIIAAAVRTCRDRLDADFAANRFTMNGKPFSKGWWTATGKLLDACASDAMRFSATLPAGAKLKTKWRYPNQSLIEPGNAPSTRIRWVVFVSEASS